MPHEKDYFTQVATGTIMDAYDEVIRRHRTDGPPAALADSLRDAHIKRATTTRIHSEAAHLDLNATCDALDMLMRARVDHGAHAMPSWQLSVEALMTHLRSISATARAALDDYDGTTHENPVDAVLAAVRAHQDPTQ